MWRTNTTCTQNIPRIQDHANKSRIASHTNDSASQDHVEKISKT